MRSAALLYLSIAAAALAACASSAPPPASVCASNAPCTGKASVTAADTGSPAVAKVWASRCGSCHVRVEPGTRDRETLEKALSRHRTRVRMDEPQWAALVEFLAAEPSPR